MPLQRMVKARRTARTWKRALLKRSMPFEPFAVVWICFIEISGICLLGISHFSLQKIKKTLPGHNGPRILSLKLELSLQLKQMQIPASALLAFLTTWRPTSMSSFSATTISMTLITSSMVQQHTNIVAKLHLQHSMQLLHHLANPIGDLLVLIEHLHVNLLLHQHLNDNHHLQIALLASSASIELVLLSARVTSVKFPKDQKKIFPVVLLQDKQLATLRVFIWFISTIRHLGDNTTHTLSYHTKTTKVTKKEKNTMTTISSKDE